jgi:mitotic-spindle organizing protein 1
LRFVAQTISRSLSQSQFTPLLKKPAETGQEFGGIGSGFSPPRRLLERCLTPSHRSQHLPEATPRPVMETEPVAARQAKESLELAFQMSQILDTGLDRHTLSLLMALCDRGANPEALAALVRELSSAAAAAASATVSNGTAAPSPTTASLFPTGLRHP